MRNRRQQCSSSVDGSTNPDDIAELFADKYKDLYTWINYGVTEMDQIRCSIEESIIAVSQVFYVGLNHISQMVILV